MAFFRFLCRLAATVLLAAAVIMAVLDATRTIAAGRLVATPLSTSWAAVSPETLFSTQDLVATRLHPLLWDPILATIIDLPGFVVFALLALLFYALGRRSRRPIGAAPA